MGRGARAYLNEARSSRACVCTSVADMSLARCWRCVLWGEGGGRNLPVPGAAFESRLGETKNMTELSRFLFLKLE